MPTILTKEEVLAAAQYTVNIPEVEGGLAITLVWPPLKAAPVNWSSLVVYVDALCTGGKNNGLVHLVGHPVTDYWLPPDRLQLERS